jgi:predicted dehydrogenase
VKPLRIALIGAGTFGRRHVEKVGREPLCELVAIADPVPGARAYAAELRVRCFADNGEMLDTVRPDAAIIATPNATHVSAGLQCAARGVHMLVEKPIADTIEAAAELVQAAERANVVLQVGHHRRYNPVIEKARDIVRGGGIGRLTAVAAQWLLRKPDDYFNIDWRRMPGGGPILINLIHDIDDLRFICGEIAGLQAFASSAARGHAVEDTAAITLRFACGALGTVTVSDAVAAPWSWELTSGEAPDFPRQDENCYLFAGTKGSLSVPKLELWRYAFDEGWQAPLAREAVAVDPADPLARQLRHFCRAVRGEEAPRITGADAARTLAVTLGVAQAAASGRVVDFA